MTSDDRAVNSVALVVVHGMGHQKSSETLLEWAEPLVRRIEWRLGVGQGVRFSDVVLGDDQPGRVSISAQYLDESGRRRILDLTVTEARWSDSFLAMKRGEIFSWGLGFLWRTVGRLGGHFSRNMALLVSEALPRGRVVGVGWRILWLVRWIWTLIVGALVAVLVAALWWFLFVASLVLSVALLVIGPLLFLPGLGRLLQGMVDAVVDFVGDVAVWTRRPVRAAAMRQAVEDSLIAAREGLPDPATAETRLIVVAHSEGAAITADLLFNQPDGIQPPRVDALLTVGAAITLLGEAQWVKGATRPGAVAAAGIGKTPVLINPVQGWSLAAQQIRWLNFWGIWDPFAAGPISTDGAARRERWYESFGLEPRGTPTAKGPEEHPLHNTALPLTDHQSYAQNIVQVIDPLARLVLDSSTATGPPSPAQTGAITRDAAKATGELLRTQLHVEGVRALGLNRVLVLFSAALVALGPGITAGFAQSVLDSLRGLLGQVGEGGWLGWLLGADGVNKYVVAVAFAAIGLWLNELLWRRYGAMVAWRRSSALATERNDGEPPLKAESVWWAGTVLRGVFLGSAISALTAAGLQPGWLIVCGVAAAILFFAPWLGRIPRVAPARPPYV
ncbi:hypothetical protein [Homoserinimonas hongtaonis]|uniref:Uncharacterized protein n=1 Tax=Homoserinimonas hongtaonis TaxID=2079791 RepID=A0A2U1SZ29_9MICO|nr:hypothetical protein [Salinibacterium hongtaonis]PWB96881.1 hypothetical protein DF220_02810 [Salinibacterium hongtaonis]